MSLSVKPLSGKALEARRQQIVELAAQGMTQVEIAAKLGVSQSTVSDNVNKPKSVQELEAIRMRVRTLVMEEAADGLVAGTLGMVRKAIKANDPKALELTTKSAVHLDKLTGSASGEAKRLEIKDTTPPPTAADLKQLIAQVLGSRHEEEAREYGFSSVEEYEAARDAHEEKFRQSTPALKSKK
jgi:DNA invertase Pin-like site-specific DNA recombinase